MFGDLRIFNKSNEFTIKELYNKTMRNYNIITDNEDFYKESFIEKHNIITSILIGVIGFILICSKIAAV